jgi:hypothetical protein
MPYAVELYFDPTGEALVRNMWQALADAGISSTMLDTGFRPHVSLAVCDGSCVDGLKNYLTLFANNVAPFPYKLSNIGVFPGLKRIVFLGVVVTRKLLTIHADFHQILEKHAAGLEPNYFPNAWVPHCTLSFGLTDSLLGKAIEVCRQQPLPIQGRFEEIGCGEISPSSVQSLCCYKLTGPPTESA